VCVLLNPLDASRRHLATLDEGTPLLEWLDAHEPNGGHLHRRVYVGGGECVDPAYRVRAGDAVLVTFAPGTAPQIAFYILQTVIAYAIGYTLNKLFGPTKPKAGETPSPSQVYGLGQARNAARLGQPIPVVYGAVITVPDFAAQPYTLFDKNEMYLHALLCIGQGQHDVSELILGDSSALQLDSTAVFWKVFQPGDHASTFGRIEADTTVRENVVTSASVADQELIPPGAGATGTPSTYYWQATGFNSYQIKPPAPPYIDMLGAPTNAAKLALMPVNPTLGTVLVGIVLIDSHGWYAVTEYTARAYTGGQSVDPYSLVPAPTPAPGASTWMGFFETCKAGQKGTVLELDFMFAGGLFTMDGSGNLGAASVAVRVEAESINDAGTPSGTVTAWTETFTATSNTAQRFTRVAPPLALGRYRVRCARTTPSDGKASTSDRCTWSGLKFQLTPPPAGTVVYGDVTLVALRLKATNGISASAAASIRFRVTRRLSPLGDGTTPAATVNPADAFADIVLAKYGGNRPRTVDELDIDALAAARTKWTGANGFNAVFDQASTVWEALTLAVQCVSAAPVPIGSRMSLIHDGPQPVPAQVFTDANVAAGSLTVGESFDTDGTPTGIRATYRDARTFSEAALLMPLDAPDYVTLNLWGCTSATVAQQLATIAANKRRLQRSTVSFTTELEGLSCLPGDRIDLQAGLMGWAQAARVVRVSGLVLTLDRPLTWTPGVTHAAALRDPEGVPTHLVGVTRGASDLELVIPSAPPFAIQAASSSMEPTQVAFGVAGAQTTAWTVTKMTPGGDGAIGIEAVNYDPAVWTGGATYQQPDADVAPGLVELV
jgi:hypothetical protein